MKIAMLDDDGAMLGHIEEILQSSGHVCTRFSSGRQLIRSLHEERFDLFVLDWNLPDLSGLSVLEWIRKQIGETAPVLLLTSRAADEDVVTALNAGADDFISKPFKPGIFLARVNALLRRVGTPGQERHAETYGHFEFDPLSRRVWREGELVEVTPKEFQLANLLFRHLNMAISRAYMLETIWGFAATAETRTLDIHISKIRRKLKLGPESGFMLSPVYGYGYRLEEVSMP